LLLLFLQKKRSSSTANAKQTTPASAPAAPPFDFRAALMGANEPYRSTTAYPHPLRASNDDLNTLGFGPPPQQQPQDQDPFTAGIPSLAYLLPQLPSVNAAAMPRPCEVHAPNAFAHYQASPAPGGGLNLARGCEAFERVCTRIFCCGSRGILARFPSRAKRIDVISRFIFPLIFAIFNLAYWLYYLFAKSKSPQLES